jgi:hypothetical protein
MWVKLDDHFPEHPKVIAAGPLAGWLDVAGLCYANRLLTDGFIPREVVPRLIAPYGPKKETAKPEYHADLLVEVGLWTTATTAAGIQGYQIHDYTTYQRTQEHVLTDRTQTSKRVTEWRRKAAQS